MRAYLKPLLMLATLALLAAAAFVAQARLIASAGAYRSPLADAPPAPGEPLSPQVERVVLVILSGLSDADSRRLPMPTLERLRESGASAVAVSEPPSYRMPAWASLVSGALPSLSDAPPLPFAAPPRPLTTPTLFEAARRQGVRIALFGAEAWRFLLPADAPADVHFAPLEGVAGDQYVMETVAAGVKNGAARLMVVQFSQADRVAQERGTESAAYRAAVEQLDGYLDALVGMLDMERTTLLVTSDYGHIAAGGHGGAEAAATELPLVMAGAKVIPGTYSPVRQVDVAPTLAALLGLPLPPVNQGRPLLEMVQIPEPEAAVVWVALAQQRTALATAYLAALGASPPPGEDVARAGVFLRQGNYAGARQLAQLLVEKADRAMQQPSPGNAGRLRGLAAAAIGAALLLLALFRRETLWGEALAAGGGTVAAYHLLYRLARLPYSLSAIVRPEQTFAQTGYRVAWSLLAGSLLFFLLLLLQPQKRGGALAVWRGGLKMALFASLGFGLPALYGLGRIGLAVSGSFPDVTVFFHTLSALQQTFWAATMGMFAAAAMAPLGVLKRGRER